MSRLVEEWPCPRRQGHGQEGEIRISRRVEDRLDDAGALPGEAGDADLLVVDQKNSIGS